MRYYIASFLVDGFLMPVIISIEIAAMPKHNAGALAPLGMRRRQSSFAFLANYIEASHVKPSFVKETAYLAADAIDALIIVGFFILLYYAFFIASHGRWSTPIITPSKFPRRLWKINNAPGMRRHRCLLSEVRHTQRLPRYREGRRAAEAIGDFLAQAIGLSKVFDTRQKYKHLAALKLMS